MMDRMTYWLERWRIHRARMRTGGTRQGVRPYWRRREKLDRRYGRG